MRVLCCAADYKPAVGGIAEFTHETTAALASMGCDVVVVAPADPGAAAFDDAQPFPIVRVPAISPLSHFSFRGLPLKAAAALRAWHGIEALSRRLETLVDHHRIDHVVCFHWDIVGAAAWRLHARRHVPYAVVCYGQEVQAQRWSLPGLLQRAVLAGAERRVAISRYTQQRMRGLLGGHHEIVISQVGVRSDVFRRQAAEPARPPGPCVVLTVSRLVERKGLDRSLDAFARCVARMPEANLEYWIAGDGPARQALESLARTLGCGERVRFLGPVSEEEKVALYRAADVFVLTPRELAGGDAEGFGIVFLEAGACEVPVVAGRSGGVPDAVADGVTGLLVDPLDAAAIADAMARLLADPDMRQRMGRAGRLRAETSFRWGAVAQRIVPGLMDGPA